MGATPWTEESPQIIDNRKSALYAKTDTSSLKLHLLQWH
jgi:hypothetical protein